MTTEGQNPYEPPAPSRPPPPERIHHPHQLARFYLLAIASVSISGICAFGLYFLLTTSYRGFSPTGLVFVVVLSVVALLGIFSAVGLVFVQTWGWYVALSQFLVILLILVVLLVVAIIAAVQSSHVAGGDIFAVVFGIALVLAPIALLLDRVTRLLLKVRWPRWLAPD